MPLEIGESAGPECKEALQEVTRLVAGQLQSGHNLVKELFGAKLVVLLCDMKCIYFSLITYQSHVIYKDFSSFRSLPSPSGLCHCFVMQKLERTKFDNGFNNHDSIKIINVSLTMQLLW